MTSKVAAFLTHSLVTVIRYPFPSGPDLAGYFVTGQTNRKHISFWSILFALAKNPFGSIGNINIKVGTLNRGNLAKKSAKNASGM
jgi:hypothetical protein